jgi:type IV secretory pathway VirB10-like protein
MAEGGPPRTGGSDDEPSQTHGDVPPPLDAIRVTGPRARGLNKPAILGAAGGGVAIVLLMASGAFTSDPARKPADARPMMSDPARPEMAKGAIRSLPSDYTQVAPPPAAREPALTPQLGPPLPGDVAAFVRPDPGLRSYMAVEEQDWREPEPYAPAGAADPLQEEIEAAERSGLFFALRDQAAPSMTNAPQQVHAMQTSRSTLTAVSPAPQHHPAGDAGSSRQLFPGAVIPASLVTEVNSESPGPVIAQVTQAVHDSATGRMLLIPQGARLIGEYASSTRYGQSRVAILWSRLIMPDGREIQLAEAALDPAGSAGVGGDVDNRWLDVFGAAALGTLINVGVATTEDPAIGYGAIGVITRDPVDAAVADGVQRTASTVTNRLVDRGLAIPPTIRVQAGAKISVIVTRRTTF